MMDCHIHYAIVTVRFCTDIFSRFFAPRNTRAGHDGQYWDDSIRKRLLRRRNNYIVSLLNKEVYEGVKWELVYIDLPSPWKNEISVT